MEKKKQEPFYRVKLRLSYDGTDFDGWQKQPHSHRTVQLVLEDALKRLFGQSVPVFGASRTDSGVHAICQYAQFDSPRDPSTFKDLCYSIQAFLPPDLVVKGAWLAPSNFDASRDPSSKIYRYVIFNAGRPSALLRKRSLWVRRPLDLDWLNESSKYLLGKQDFKSFQNTGGTVKTTVREIYSAKWFRHHKNLVVFEIHGSGFLKQMVRNIVGTLLDLEGEKANPQKIQEILEARDRKRARTTASPQGLYLYRIFYPDLLDNKCRKL